MPSIASAETHPARRATRNVANARKIYKKNKRLTVGPTVNNREEKLMEDSRNGCCPFLDVVFVFRTLATSLMAYRMSCVSTETLRSPSSKRLAD